MPRVEVLAPVAGEVVDLDGPELRSWLADRYALPGGRRVRVDVVTSLDGRLVGAGGTSEDLTGGIDRTVLGTIRRSADVVLVGAGSVRAERLRMPRTAALAIATRSGTLRPDVIPPADGDRRPIVLCPAPVAPALASRLGGAADVEAVDGDPGASPALLVDALAARGLGRIVCEGGAALASALLEAGLVDELDQTIAPALVGDGPALTARRPDARLDGLLRDGTDRLYARWRLRSR